VQIVIVGARLGRDDDADKVLVDQIIDDCKDRYAKLLIVTKSGDKGVGKFILDRCRSARDNGDHDFDMIEISLRHILKREIPKNEFLGHFYTLNAALVELGDEFHLLAEEFPAGAMQDILKRIKERSLLYALYKPSELNGGPKRPTLDGGTSISTISSNGG